MVLVSKQSVQIAPSILTDLNVPYGEKSRLLRSLDWIRKTLASPYARETAREEVRLNASSELAACANEIAKTSTLQCKLHMAAYHYRALHAQYFMQ